MEKPFRAYVGDEPFVFVCYSHEDAGIVYPEIQWLHEHGIRVWYDEGISAGKVWRAEIATTIQRASKFLFYISEASLRSEHCNREIEYALDKRIPVVPVYLNKTELPPELDLALNRVQALHRSGDSAYRDHLFEALGSVSMRQMGPVVRARRPSLAKWLVLILAIAVLAGGGWWYGSTGAWRAIYPETAEATGERSIVVLPFATVGNDPENDYLADGFSEELMTTLAKVPGLRLAARTSAFYFKTHPADLTTIGDSLNVRYALEGSMRRSGDELRVTASLIDIENGFELASLVLDRTLGDLLKLQSDIAMSIVDAFALQLTNAQVQSATAAGTTSEQAFDLFLKAGTHMRSDNANDYGLAETLYRAAIALDPHSYAAYNGLAFSLLVGAFRTADYEPAYTRLQELREQLEVLDPDGTQPAFAPARFLWAELQRDWPTAEALAQAQFATNANDVLWLGMYARLLGNAGLFAASLDYHNLTRKLDPFDPNATEKAGDMLLALGRKDEALAAYERCLELVPARIGCLGQKAVALFLMGRLDEARALFADNPPRIFRCVWGDLTTCKPYDLSDPSYNLVLAIGAGDFDAAFEWLNRAADLPFGFVNQTRWQNVWWPSGLVTDPRYQQLLERIKLTDQWKTELCQRARTLTPKTGIAVTCA